ncbi:zinc-dependent alcohol dehydrogenase [Streptomyces oceani]|uniref:2-deoxy-scyllo-inosamine dehydrogenase n=1 Tax=Streptomyces oceani TaxID=1075402 RepID=A0A1E7KFC1_9ACTN|nr:alcohol dehydrogenase catalytic domain-containing protein [Streptomyces oceani]OEV02618.1 dehydrogenase [Streptomyces oceani]
MTVTARAIVLDKPGTHRLVRGPAAEPGAGDVRISVRAVGLCASDREVYDGTRALGYVRYPVVPGHEWSGTVDRVGEGVDPELVGRKAVAEGIRACHSCERCREGATNLCESGYDEMGFTRPGAMADHLIVPVTSLHTLDDKADLRAAALLEPAAVSAAAVMRAEPRPGDRVAVLGAGTLGLLTVQLLQAYSPVELTVIDPRVRRAEHALTMGATQAAGHAETGVLRGRFDLVLETAGAPGSAQDACRLTRRGGRTVITGMFEPGAQGIDPVHLAVSQLTVHAVFGAPSRAWSYALRAFAAGLLDPAPLITHEFPLTAFDEAIDLVESVAPEVGKVLVCPPA